MDRLSLPLRETHRMKAAARWTSAVALLCATVSSTVGAVTDSERVALHAEFRTLFDAAKYAEALPVAERVVALSEEQYGKDARSLVNPLTNLGTTQLRMQNYAAAETSYRRAVSVLEAGSTSTDRALVRPLHGLGMTYLAARQYADAATSLKRALDLSRNLDGLFNLDQRTILEPLIAAYVAGNRISDAEKEQEYALRVAEQNFGTNDVRMLGPIDTYARWLEFVGRYSTAREKHYRALGLAESRVGRSSVATVAPLRGISRTYRLEYVNGAEIIETPTTDATFGSMAESRPAGLNPNGLIALTNARHILMKQEPRDRQTIAEVETELGDWYVTNESIREARVAYRQAWENYKAAGATAPLDAPRQLAYRGPQASIARFRGGDIDDFEERFVEVVFTVKQNGDVDDVKVTSADAAESYQRTVVSSARRAVYAPRVVEGELIDTPGVTLRERLLIKKPKSERD